MWPSCYTLESRLRETIIQAKIRAVLNHRDSPCRVWRNNVGVLPDSRGIPLRYGLAVGSADLVGLIKKTGQFLAVEVKTPRGRLSAEQKAWLNTIHSMGGVVKVMRTAEEAEAFVRELQQHT